MIEIDGSYLEGGGQILRTSLALSATTGKPFRITKIRAFREDPGMKAQHLNCVLAMQKLTNAEVKGDELGSAHLEFIPKQIEPKTISIDIGTAGSIPLLLQSMTLPCSLSKGKVRLRLTGGTDVKWSPQIDYFENVILPFFRVYADYEMVTEKRGYYPKGGGFVDITLKSKFKYPDLPRKPFNMRDQPRLIHIYGKSHASKNLEISQVAERQAKAARKVLSTIGVPISIEHEYFDTLSAGSGITLWTEHDFSIYDYKTILGADELGEVKKSSEEVGELAGVMLSKLINSKIPIDEHLCDNLIPLLGLQGGIIRTTKITDHTKSNIYVCEKFLDVKYIISGNIIEVKK